ncbi:hypothetical protein [Algoriphagus sp. A40]|uniref:hypothetical protein n=1 Tax=Algoriphagus sp. A40 TaxID=1945863 RepID=UPI00098687E8|nr:hypothetical protein [Algoriphagus sp. A40]OOG76185.1 hypothetical protein B0E43_09090 [Algoriphagus sp. A40]
MMKTTNTYSKWLRFCLLVPIGAVMIYAFSDQVFAHSESNNGEGSVEVIAGNWEGEKSPAMAAYLDKYGKYQLKAYENFIFKNRTIAELQALFGVYLEFDALFLDLSLEERLMVKRPEFPYVRFEKDGVEYYKKLNELNAEERKKIGC